MPNEPRRVVDPSAPTSGFAGRRMGVRGQHETDVERQRQGKTTDDPARRAIIVPTQTVRFERDEVTASGGQVLRLSDTAGIQISTALRYPLGAAGRFLGLALWSRSARLTGTAYLRIRLSKGGGTEELFDYTDCVIDGATVDGHVRSEAAALWVPWPNGRTFAKGDAFRAEIVFDSYTPSPSDWMADVTVGYAGLSGT